eukprot:12466225-Alexandrium_andersonii.AAC.1
MTPLSPDAVVVSHHDVQQHSAEDDARVLAGNCERDPTPPNHAAQPIKKGSTQTKPKHSSPAVK